MHNQAKVIVCHRRRPLIEKMDSSRELITVVECTYADSFMLPPLVIYKGLYCGWFTKVVGWNAKFAHSNKGYNRQTGNRVATGHLTWRRESRHEVSHGSSSWTVIALITALR